MSTSIPVHSPEDAQRLDPRSVTAGRIGGYVFVLMMTGFTMPGIISGLVVSGKWGIWFAFGVVLAVIAGLGFLMHMAPLWRYRYTWYRVDAYGIEISRGRIVHRLITVPHARVQHLDVSRGPIERRFGLATLVIYTAGHANSEVKLEGLSHEAALELRERLVKERGLDAV